MEMNGFNRQRLEGLGAVLLAALVLSCSARPAEQAPESTESLAFAVDWLVPVHFLILKSSLDYSEALRVAKDASTAMGIELDLRGLEYNSDHGLTLPPQECEREEVPYPCYMARGRYDDGIYISIERSDAYASFRPGLFVVIAGSSSDDSADLDPTLDTARERYPDAYIKTDNVYMGCIH